MIENLFAKRISFAPPLFLIMVPYKEFSDGIL